MNLVLVESPAKAKTIEKYLGNDYSVMSSFGHIRDLPKNVSTGKSFIAKDGFGFVDLTKKRMLPSEERRLKMESSQSKNPSTVFPQQQPASSFNFFDLPLLRYLK